MILLAVVIAVLIVLFLLLLIEFVYRERQDKEVFQSKTLESK